MTTVTLEAAQRDLPELVDGVALGEHVVITKDHAPIAELVPVGKAKPKPVFGSAKGMIEMSDHFDAPLDDLAPYTE